MFASLKNRGWTRVESAIWLLASFVAIIAGILVFADVIGSGVFLVTGVIATIVGLMRYRAETRVTKSLEEENAGRQ